MSSGSAGFNSSDYARLREAEAMRREAESLSKRVGHVLTRSSDVEFDETAPVRDRSEIQIRLDHLEKCAHSLRETASRLAERLGPVTSPAPSVGDANGPCPPSVSCSLSAAIYEVEGLLSRTDRELRELIDGLLL